MPSFGDSPTGATERLGVPQVDIDAESLTRGMILPGLISVAFYRRRPTTWQIVMGLVFTIVVSALLGYWQDYGTSRVWENTILAAVGGVILYVAILAYLLYRYFPKRTSSGAEPTLPPSSPHP